MGSKVLKKVAKFALPIAGGILGGPAGAAIGGALGGAVGGGGLKGALLGGATGFAGNAIGNSLSGVLSKGLGSVGNTSIGSLTAKNTLGPYSFGDLGNTAANSIGNSIANTTVGSAIGRFAGNSIADNLGQGLFGEQQTIAEPVAPKMPSTPEPSPFEPTREPQLQLPGSLSSFNSLDPNQQSSNLATQGVYGGGNGPQEEDYFTNMINRRLVDDTGHVDQDLSEISPIESSYLSQLGLGGYNNPSSLLEAIYGRKNPKQAAYA